MQNYRKTSSFLVWLTVQRARRGVGMSYGLISDGLKDECGIETYEPKTHVQAHEKRVE